MSIKKLLLTFVILVLSLVSSNAAIKIEKKFKSWESQYIESGDGKICFAVSMPVKMTPESLNRAESRIFITFRPKDGVSNEISITNGYPLKKKSDIEVDVGNASFKFLTKDKFGWLPSLNDELKMINVMKKSNKAIVSGVSARGNKTKDTYSLMGFTDAYNAARKNCS
jgi:hypothetical protein